MLEEIVRQQLICRGTALDVHAQTDRQESLELLAQLLRLLEAGRAVGRNQVQGLERLLVEVGWLRFDHLNRHNTERPNIHLGAVLLLLHHLGRHPVWRADHGGALRLGIRELGAESKIGYYLLVKVQRNTRRVQHTNLDIAAGVQEDIVTLDITVDNVLSMKMLQTAASL